MVFYGKIYVLGTASGTLFCIAQRYDHCGENVHA